MMNLRITNQNLLASNVSLLEGNPKTTLTADKASGVTTLTVANITGFAVDQYALLGNLGEPTAEIVRLHASSAPSGTTITLAAATVFDHYVDTPITMIQYNQVEFSRATTLTGSKSVLTTVGIMANREDTWYKDTTNSTGYGFFRFKNSGASTFSGYSTGVNYTGNDSTSAEYLAREGCALAGVKLNDDNASEDQILNDINEAQDRIAESGDWIHELIKNDTSIASTQNENEYALSGLTYEVKYNGTEQGILDVRFGSSPLKKLNPDEMDAHYEGTAKTTLASAITAADTTVTLTDSYEFSETGSIYVGANAAAQYTANAQPTGVLSGFSASAFTANVASGANVFQNVIPGMPTQYAIFDGSIILDAPVATEYAGRKLKFKYLKKMTRLTDFAGTTEIPFCSIIPFYIAYKINTRRSNFDEADKFWARFFDGVAKNKGLYMLPTLEEGQYYEFSAKP